MATGWFDGLSDAIAEAHGDSIKAETLYDLGNPFTGKVQIELAQAEMPGLVWIHNHVTTNTVVSGQPELVTDDANIEDAQSPTRALLLGDKIPDDLLIYGVPVFVKEQAGVLTVTGLGGVMAAEYLYGLKNHPQRSIDVSQFDYGLIKPTAPPSGKVLLSSFRPALDGFVYDVPTLVTIDLIDTYGAFVLPQGIAKAVKIEVDPATNILYYTVGSTFLDTTHKLAFEGGYYPKTITAGHYLYGWVKLYGRMTVIGVNDLYPAQELFSKASISGFAALATMVTCAGDVVTSNGQVVWST